MSLTHTRIRQPRPLGTVPPRDPDYETCGCEESVVLRAEVERLRQALHDRIAAEAMRARSKATP